MEDYNVAEQHLKNLMVCLKKDKGHKNPSEKAIDMGLYFERMNVKYDFAIKSSEYYILT